MTLSREAPVVLVTGGSSGIGRATALAFAREGAQVVVAARGRHRAMEVVRAIELAGGDGYFIPTDVGVAAEVERLGAQILDLYGGLHYAVNAAAATDPVIAPTAEITEEEFDLVHAASLKGVWLCMRAEIPLIEGSGGGAIVNVASLDGLHGRAAASHYAAAKQGVIGLSRTAALEYGPRGIRINCVCPGPTDTPLLRRVFDILGSEEPGGAEAVEEAYRAASLRGRIGTPEEVASLILWLCSEEAVLVNGGVVPADGGPVPRGA